MIRALGLMAALAVLGNAFAAQSPANYHLIGQVRVPGDSAWDYLSIDETARRLYVTHGDHIDVLDIDRNRLVGRIEETPGVHGFAIDHELQRGYASDGQTSQISVVDLATLTTLARVTAGTGPDAIAFNPRHDEVYSFNGAGRSSTVISAKTNRLITTLVLPGRPEFAVVDTSADRVYVNIEDRNLLIAIDGQSHRVMSSWQIAPGQSPSSLAIDVAHHRLFVGCRNQKLLMVDAQNGSVRALVPIGRGVDATAFDPQTQLVFSSSGDGTLTIAREETADQLRVVQSLGTPPGARTMALDPATHMLYLVAGDSAIPGSFRVLIYAP